MYKAFAGLLNRKEKKNFFFLTLAFALLSLMESLTYGLIPPFIAIISKNEKSIAIFHRIAHFLLPIEVKESSLPFIFTISFFCLITLKMLFQAFVNYRLSEFPYKWFARNSETLFENYLNEDFAKLTQRNSSILVKHCVQTLLASAQSLILYLRYLAMAFMSISLCILMLIQNFFLSSALIIIIGFVSFLTHVLAKKPQQKAGEIREKALSNCYKIVSDAFLCFKEIKLYEKQAYFTGNFTEHIKTLSKQIHLSNFRPSMPQAYLEWTALSIILAIISAVLYLNIPIESIIVPLIFYGAVGRRLLPSVNQVIKLHLDLHHYLPTVNICKNELSQFSNHKNPDPYPKAAFQKEIRFEDVSFSYSKSSKALNKLTFTIPKNKSIAFVGPSGSGKSTLVDLMVALLKVQSGKIFIDDQEFENLKPIVDKIAYVPQIISLLDDTIEKNVAFGEINPDKKKVLEALKAANLDEFVLSLKEKTDTFIGEKGIRLSGGQKQRVVIARAIYRNPEILIFDEATSSLDSISEKTIGDTIKNQAGEKTIITIAHRLTSVKHYDKIFVMDKGAIIAEGTHDELFSACLLYRKMCGADQKMYKIKQTV